MFSRNGPRRIGDDLRIGDRGIACVDHQRYVERGLQRRLVEAGKGAPRIGGFKLCDAVGALPGAREIKSAQLVVEDAGVGNLQRDRSRRKFSCECECGLLLFWIERDGGDLRRCDGVAHSRPYGLEFDLRCIERNSVGGCIEHDVDGLAACKSCLREVRCEGQRVVFGPHAARKPLRLRAIEAEVDREE